MWLIKPAIDYNRGISELINKFDNNMPDFVLENGRLTVYAKMPYVLYKDKDALMGY